jgi:hypothetical protein
MSSSARAAAVSWRLDGVATAVRNCGARPRIISLPEHRAKALAGLYLAAYVGLAGPVIGLGALTQVASTRVSLLVFSGLLALGIFAAPPALLGGRLHRASPQPQPISH